MCVCVFECTAQEEHASHEGTGAIVVSTAHMDRHKACSGVNEGL